MAFPLLSFDQRDEGADRERIDRWWPTPSDTESPGDPEDGDDDEDGGEDEGIEEWDRS